jgi:NAD(P)-dependent dehydrogenase (short-subunit alcohol dehydrogenase family)
MTHHVIRQMVREGSGHIVNITASLVDHANIEAPSPLASLTKGGLDAVTRSLATEYASRGVRVNAVAPGVIKTPVHDPSSYEGMSGPLGRIGEISDIIDGILFLERATFVTGETLHIDGGRPRDTDTFVFLAVDPSPGPSGSLGERGRAGAIRVHHRSKRAIR